MFDDYGPFRALFSLTRNDVSAICGPDHAVAGWRLCEANAVHEHTLTGVGLEAQVVDQGVPYEVEVYTEEEVWGACDCTVTEDCAHVAAVLYEWLRSPDLFMPRTVGDFLGLLEEDSFLHDMVGDSDPRVKDILGQMASIPEELREALTEMPLEALDGPAPLVAAQQDPSAYQAAIEFQLQQILESCKIQELRAIVRRRGFDVKGTAKADIAEQLVPALRDSVGQPDWLQALSREELEALRLLNTVYGVRDYLTWQEAEYAWTLHKIRGGAQSLRKALEGLFEYGLVFPCRIHDDSAQHYHWLSYLPTARLPVLQPTIGTYPRRKRRRLFRPESTPPVPATLWLLVAFMERETSHLRTPAVRRTQRTVRHPQAQHHPWLSNWEHDPDEADRLIQQGHGDRYTYSDASITVPTPRYWVTDDVLDQLAPWLGADHSFASWMIILAIIAGLLTVPPTSETAPELIEERWVEWTGFLPEEQLRHLFNAWRWHGGGLVELALALRRHPDLRLERSIRYTDFEPQELAQELAEARRFVTRLLQELPAGTWLDWNQFANWARRIDPEFLHSYWSPEVWGFTTHGGQRLDPTRQRHWEVAYRPVLAAFIEGPLRWLGVVQVLYRGHNLITFRLTETGAWLLRDEGEPTVIVSEKPDAPPVTWLDERTFQVQPLPEMLDLLRLAGSFATPTNQPYTYKLSEANIERAFTRGLRPAVFAGAFQKLGVSLPEATRRDLEDLWSHFGRVHLYENLTVLELADDLALREVLANTKLKDHIIHEFSPRLVVVEDSAVDELVEELVKKGYTPKLVDSRRSF